MKQTEASRRLQKFAGKRLNRELTKRMFQKAGIRNNASQVAGAKKIAGII